MLQQRHDGSKQGTLREERHKKAPPEVTPEQSESLSRKLLGDAV